jgi:superfamily II DNA/RNA helicase
MFKLNTDFTTYDLAPELLSAIKSLGYAEATDVQAKAIPAILEGGDVLAGAETGSGKTAAFVLPVLQKILEQRAYQKFQRSTGNHISALILVPTRELIAQTQHNIDLLSQVIKPNICCVTASGGEAIDTQIKALKHGADILVATPQRVLDLHEQRAMQFNHLQTLVLDEADRLTTGGLNQAVEEVFRKAPNRTQVLMFTATFPDSIRHWVRKVLQKPKIINIELPEEVSVDEHAIKVDYDRKTDLLAHLIDTYDWEQILVFANAKKTCDRLVDDLQAQNIQAIALHGDKAPEERLQVLDDFKQKKINILVATDVAARGVDIPQLPCVINYELPREPNDYIHRIGRTGRAGHKGQALSLIAHHEFQHFKVIEKRNKLYLEREVIEGFEPSAEAPLMPKRTKKKSNKKQLSKKKKQLSKKKKQRQQQK